MSNPQFMGFQVVEPIEQPDDGTTLPDLENDPVPEGDN